MERLFPRQTRRARYLRLYSRDEICGRQPQNLPGNGHPYSLDGGGGGKDDFFLYKKSCHFSSATPAKSISARASVKKRSDSLLIYAGIYSSTSSSRIRVTNSRSPRRICVRT